jgi:hypothetical protein
VDCTKKNFSACLSSAVATNLFVCRDDGRHVLAYELAWRRLVNPTCLASRPVVTQLGDQLKSAVSYTFKTNTYDNPEEPTHGQFTHLLGLMNLLALQAQAEFFSK